MPSPDETKAFLADQSKDRRAKLVDRLLNRPEFYDFWTLKFADILRANGRLIQAKGANGFTRWIKTSLERDVPMDEFVRELITAEGSSYSNPAANYYRISRDPENSVETTAQLFLGVRIQCAKCHNHPFERWTQDDYYGFAAFFSRVRQKKGPLPDDEVIFASDSGEVNQPRTGQTMKPKALGGPVLDDKGNVVGVAQSIIVATGINFAIPVSRLQKFLKDPNSHPRADTPPPAPEPSSSDSPRPSDLGADPFHGKEWELTSYLKGTAPQIRDKLNGEVERLVVGIKEAQDNIKKYDQACTADEKNAIEKVRASALYKSTAAEKARAEQDLEAARKSGSSQEKLDASSRFNKARIALEKLEHDAVTNCEELSQDRHRMYESQHDIKRLNEAAEKALAWREELLDATRNGFMMKGPPLKGAKGTLPRITIAKILDSSRMIVDYDMLTFDYAHPGKEKEGIKVLNATKERIKILLSGVNTSKLKQGDKISLDHVFVLEGSQHSDNQGTIYEAGPFPSDADILFDAIVPLRQSVADVKHPKGGASNSH